MEDIVLQGDKQWSTQPYRETHGIQLQKKYMEKLLEIFVFSEGAQINIPERKKENIELPPWRKTT